MHESDTSRRAAGLILGRYQLLRRIGRGGMGDVWLAEDPRLHRQVAIKTLPLRSQSDSEFAQRFEREARAAAALNHPHILPVHDYGRQTLPNGQIVTYIVMPYVSGGSLADRIVSLSENHAAMQPGEAIHYLSQVAEAIDYAHAQGVVHRDIKPGNMLLRSDNWLLLADFGIARILSDQEQLTRTGAGFGTPEYMAPEQAQGRAEPASDNYSLAVIAFQLFTGRLPFEADSSYATMVQHILTPPPLPQQINLTLSLSAEQALLHGLAKDPARRPPSARALVAELQRAAAGAAFEPTYVRQPLPSTEGAPLLASSPGGRGETTTVVDRPFTGDGNKLTAPPATTGLTRRQVMIGGGAALLVAGGGLGAWAISSALHTSTHNPPQSSTTRVAATATANPDTPVVLLGHNQPISSLAWFPKTNMLASSGLDGFVMLWNIQAGQTTQPVKKAQFEAPNGISLAWSPDGSFIALGNAAFDNSTFDTKMYVYKADLSGFAPGFNDGLTFPGVTSIDALCWAPGRYLITATAKSFTTNSQLLLELWDVTQPQQRFSLFKQAGIPYALAPSPSGSMLALSTDSEIIIGQVALAGKTAQFKQLIPPLKNPSGLERLAWSPDENHIAAVGQYSDSISIWDWRSKQQNPYQLYLPGATQAMNIAWSPSRSNPQLAVKGLNGEIFLWSIALKSGAPASQTPTRTLTGLTTGKSDDIAALAWSADGQWLAAGYNDTNDSILLWKM